MFSRLKNSKASSNLPSLVTTATAAYDPEVPDQLMRIAISDETSESSPFTSPPAQKARLSPTPRTTLTSGSFFHSSILSDKGQTILGSRELRALGRLSL